MIKLTIDSDKFEAEMYGTDEKIVGELSTGIIMMLQALEKYHGNSVQENLASLILQLIAKAEGE